MSSESIDLLWNDSIGELKQLVQEEEKHDATKSVSINDAFHHFAKLYIRYTIILSDLNKCHESAVQPQKRLEIKSTLEHIICRVINLRHLLSKWSPPNPDIISKGGIQAPFSWEYLDINTELRELSISPSKLEITTPAFFREAQKEATRHRNSSVASLLQEQFGSEDIPLEEKSWSIESSAEDDASGGAPRQCVTKSVEKSNNDTVSGTSTAENLPEQAVAKIQSIVRGHLSRKKTKIDKQWLDSFVGLCSYDDGAEIEQLESNLIVIHHQRQHEQRYCKESYENDLHRLKDVVREEEGFAMQNDLREERIQWITDHTISKNTLPDSFEGFYANDTSHKGKESEGKQEDSSKKDSVKSAKDTDKKSKDKKSVEVEEVERPTLAAPQTTLDPLRDSVRIYEERWMHRNVGPDRAKSQYHDIEMAKDLIIRDQVKSDLTKGVEETLLSNILKIKAMQEADTKKSKSKKDGKGKGNKTKGKKVGGKKEKPLPGAKLPGMKEMSVEEMLSVLVQNGLVCTPEECTTNHFIGGFENGRPKLPDADKQERWVPDDPSAFQLRKTIMEYCILPLGSESIKSNIQDNENIRSVLLYGPEGSGKTLMVQAVASEIGALLITLSSSTIDKSFGGKEGATKLIHMAFTVAKEKAYAPVVIHIDNCHDFFMGKSKRGGGLAVNTEMQRFQKDLLVYKNQALKKEDRVIVIGCTNKPESGDVKLLRWKGPSGKPEKQGFFERSLYFPRANNADRAMMWKGFIQQRIAGVDEKSKVPQIDYDALAFLSDGFNAGEILSTVSSILSEDRLKSFASKPLSEHDFARCVSTKLARRDDGRFLTFTRQISTLDSMWKSINGGDRKSADSKKKKK